MPLYKSAQFAQSPEDEVIFYTEAPHAEHMDELEVEEPQGFKFSFPNIPKSNATIEVSDEGDKPKSEHRSGANGPKDIWDWQAGGIGNLLPWVQERLDKMPTHTGETSGIERLINYLKKLDSEISKAIQTDFEGKIDVRTLEGARKYIYESMDSLEDAHKNLVEKHYKKKKAATVYDEAMVKEARTAYTGGIIVTVPLLISRIARMLINGSVSNGQSIESMYENQVKKFALTVREQAELAQHMEDMGFPVVWDREYVPGEEVSVGAGIGELATGYYA